MSPLLLFGIFAGAIAAGYAYRGRHKTAQQEPPPPMPPAMPPASPPPLPPIPTAPPPGVPVIAPSPSSASVTPPPSASAPVFRPYRFERTHTGFVHDQVNLNDRQIARWQAMIYGAATVWAPRMGVSIDSLARMAIAWMGVESGGNICAVGDKTKTIDGAPREIGLWQLYNPTDFKALGIDPHELVAYCIRPAPGKQNPQKLARAMTPLEEARHVEIGMRFLDRELAYARRYLAAAGAQWGAGTVDEWRAAKLVHALPVIVNTGIAQVTRKLGRAPSSWREFRQVYETINSRAIYKPGKKHQDQDGYWRALQNAEWTGSHVAPFANV